MNKPKPPTETCRLSGQQGRNISITLLVVFFIHLLINNFIFYHKVLHIINQNPLLYHLLVHFQYLPVSAISLSMITEFLSEEISNSSLSFTSAYSPLAQILITFSPTVSPWLMSPLVQLPHAHTQWRRSSTAPPLTPATPPLAFRVEELKQILNLLLFRGRRLITLNTSTSTDLWPKEGAITSISLDISTSTSSSKYGDNGSVCFLLYH